MKRSNKKGFTLVELLVVIAIIAIIAAVAVPVTITQIDKAKIGAAMDEANNVRNTLNPTLQEIVGEIKIGDTTTGYKFDAADVASTLYNDLSGAFTKMEQVTAVYAYNDGTSGNIVITIATKATAAKAKDVAKNYVGIDTAGTGATLFDGKTAAGAAKKSACLQYTFPIIKNHDSSNYAFNIKITTEGGVFNAAQKHNGQSEASAAYVAFDPAIPTA